MIHRQLCLYGIRSLLDSEKGPDGKTSIQIRFHPNIYRPCDDYIATCAVDATEQYIELLNRRVDTVEQLVGGMKANTLKLSALVKECVAAVSEQSHDDEDVEDNENIKKEKKKLFTKRRRIIQTFVNSVRVNHPAGGRWACI